MRYRVIPSTRLEVSALCLGCGAYGSGIEAGAARDLLDRFVEAGGNFVDTANIYGKWLPDKTAASEIVIGAWMKARGNRESVIVGTKGGHPHLESMHIPRLSPHEIAADLEESLRNLGTDYIDLYWLHRDDPNRPVAEIVEALNEHVARGKIRYFGCSNWSTGRMQDAHAYCIEHSVSGFVASQVMWNFAQPNEAAFGFPGMVGMDDEMLAFHVRTGLAAIPYNAQASGLFTKALHTDFDQAPAYERIRARYLNPTTRRRMERVKAFAAQHGVEPTQVGVAFLMSHPFVTVPVVGPKNPQQLASSLGAVEVTLSDEDIAFIAG